MAKHSTLLEFVNRRARLAGASLLDAGDPWFLPTDRFRATAEAAGRRYVSFAHYDYLDLSGHPEVQTEAGMALKMHGTSVSASRLVGGEREIQRELETELAMFTGHAAALVLTSGYLTNVAILGHLLGKEDLILYDELCHNSIQFGVSTSRATSKPFRHNDLDHLKSLLIDNRDRHRHCLLIAESIYSMDGDIVDLPCLIALKKDHACWLLVDEAHSIGTLGPTGRGICEHFQVSSSEVDLTIGTLSKALVSTGGYIAAAELVIWWLRYTLPGFVFSVGISPMATAAARAALRLLSGDESHRVKLQQQQSEFFLQAAKARGLDTANAMGRSIIPIHVPDNISALAVSKALLEVGIYVPPILRVGVPRDKPRLRFFVRCTHTDQQIEQTLDIVSRTLA